MMKTIGFLSIALATTMAACASPSDDTLGAEIKPAEDEGAYDGTGPVPEGCVKIEGEDIGDEGIEIDLGDCVVTIDSWTEKEDGGDFVGFDLSFTCDVDGLTFTVKSGLDVHNGSGDSWENPNGTSGPDAKGISNITFCYEGEEETCYDRGDCTCEELGNCEEETCYDRGDCTCEELGNCEEETCEDRGDCPVECTDPNGCGTM